MPYIIILVLVIAIVVVAVRKQKHQLKKEENSAPNKSNDIYVEGKENNSIEE